MKQWNYLLIRMASNGNTRGQSFEMLATRLPSNTNHTYTNEKVF